MGTNTPFSTSTWPHYPNQAFEFADTNSKGQQSKAINDAERKGSAGMISDSTKSASQQGDASASTKYRSHSVLSTSTSGSMVEDPTLFEEMDISLSGETGAPGRSGACCTSS